MAHSGMFDGTNLDDRWADYDTLIAVCVRAKLTNRQAEVTLLLCRGCSYGQVQLALDVPWKEVWRCVHRTNHKLEMAFPELWQLAELIKTGEEHPERERWQNHAALREWVALYFDASEARALYEAYKGPRRGDGKSPLLAVDEDSRRVFMPGAHPQLVTVRDFGGGRFSAPTMKPLDLLPVLLEELAKMQKEELALAS